MKKIAYLGAGTWGFALASLLAANGHEVTMWTRDPAFAALLNKKRAHPKLPDCEIHPSVRFTSQMEEALAGAEVLVESVTSAGVRPVFEEVARCGGAEGIPIILTSKGIEQRTGFLLPEVVESVLGAKTQPWIGCLSGPSHAEEVIRSLPASVVCSAYTPLVIDTIHAIFSSPTFRIYPNRDLNGVCFGGAMKNIIAIACGISDGMNNGDNAKASLLTRGLHEIRKLSITKGCLPETLNGLSGLGDLCVTCMSQHSRNYRFGKLIAEGFSPEGARQKIGMAIEGIYSCVSARELGRKHNVPVPITEVTHAIIYDELDPREAVRSLLQRTIKEERL